MSDFPSQALDKASISLSLGSEGRTFSFTEPTKRRGRALLARLLRVYATVPKFAEAARTGTGELPSEPQELTFDDIASQIEFGDAAQSFLYDALELDAATRDELDADAELIQVINAFVKVQELLQRPFVGSRSGNATTRPSETSDGAEETTTPQTTDSATGETTTPSCSDTASPSTT